MRLMFTPDALNTINYLYYTRCSDAFSSRANLADFFVVNRSVNECLAREILKHRQGRVLRVKELCFGGRLPLRWRSFIPAFVSSNIQVQVVLSDVDDVWIPIDDARDSSVPQMSYSTEKYSLFNSFENLDTEQRFNVLLCVYGFDSVWLPEDRYLKKEGGCWYQTKFRLKVLEEHVKSKALSLFDFSEIEIEQNEEEIDLQTFEYGEFIEERYGHLERVALNFPGGLLKRIQEAFETQISENGVFIICDTAVCDAKGFLYMKESCPDPYGTSGKVAKYKQEDYGLAKKLLQRLGYHVELKTVGDFCESYGHEAPPFVEDQWVLLVARSGSAI